MMNLRIKEVFFLTIFLLGVLLISSIVSSVGVDDAEESIRGVVDGAKDIKENPGEILNKTKSSFFSENSFFLAFDSFMKSVNLIFIIFLGMNYSFSFSFLLAVVAWVFLLTKISFYLNLFFESKPISFAVAFSSVLLMARFSFFSSLITPFNFLYKMVPGFIPFFFLMVVLVLIIWFTDNFVHEILKRRIKKIRELKSEYDQSRFDIAKRNFLAVFGGGDFSMGSPSALGVSSGGSSSSGRAESPEAEETPAEEAEAENADEEAEAENAADEEVVQVENRDGAEAPKQREDESVEGFIMKISSVESKKDLRKIKILASKKFHPDRGGNQEDMKKINEAIDKKMESFS